MRKCVALIAFGLVTVAVGNAVAAQNPLDRHAYARYYGILCAHFYYCF